MNSAETRKSVSLPLDENTFLCALLEAAEHWEADERHARAWAGTFLLIVNTTGLKPALLGDFAHERIRPSLIDDLADGGDLRLEPPQAGVERKFALTAAGRRRANAITQTCSHVDAVDLSWPILLARLEIFVKRYELAGAPQQGLPLGSEASPHMRTLLSAGYLEETNFRTAHQTFVRPPAEALALTRAWPSAQRAAADAVDELVHQLDGQPGSEATSLRAALGLGSRDLLVEVLGAVIAKQSGLG
jgi:hypothetical protein